MVLVVIVHQKVVDSIINHDDVRALIQDVCDSLQLFQCELISRILV